MKRLLAHGFGPVAPRRKFAAAWDGTAVSWASAGKGKDDDLVTVQAAGEAPIPAGADPLTAVFPQRYVLQRTLRLPSADTRELRDMASLQAARILPLPPEEIASDVEILGGDADGFSDVILHLARKTDVARALEAYKAAGAHPARLVPASIALAALAGRLPASQGTVLLAERAGESLTIVMVHGKKITFSRGVRVTGDERVREVLAESREVHAKNSGTPPERAWVGGENQENFRAMVESVFGAQADVFPENILKGAMPCAAGAAMLSHRAAPDLLSGEPRHAARSHRAGEKKTLALLSALSFVFLGMGGTRAFQARERKLNALEKNWSALAPEAKELQKMEARLAGLKRPGAGGSLMETLSSLNAILPERTSLTSLSFDIGRGALITGQAASLSDAVSAVKALQNAAIFHAVELKSSNARSIQGRDVIEFQIQISFSKGDRP